MSPKMKQAALMTFATVAATALIVPSAFAAEPSPEFQLNMAHGSAKAIAAALAISVAVVGGALGQGRAAAAALEGIARNPGASGRLLTPMILGLALIESLVIYALLIAFQLVPSV
jgi:F-type H+-transporting ATPase subunit c